MSISKLISFPPVNATNRLKSSKKWFENSAVWCTVKHKRL
jgi:hypothetical protein